MVKDPKLQEAIQSFPVTHWLAKHTRVYGSGQNATYADCPVCKGKKKLGVYHESRNVVCGRCKEGGHGRGLWDGVSSLPRFIKIIEGISWRETFKLIHRLSGIKSEWKPDKKPFLPHLPPEENLVALDDCPDDERSVLVLRDRHLLHLRSSAHLCVGGKYHERIVVPTRYLETLTGFEAKATVKGQEPKSLYPDGMETDKTVYTIRGWTQTRQTYWAAVTESVFDAETFHDWGYAIGCYGAFKDTQIEAISKLGVEGLFWFLDGDAWDKLLPALKSTWGLFENFIVPMPEKEDPNSLGPDGCRELFEQAERVRDELDFMDMSHKWGRRV